MDNIFNQVDGLLDETEMCLHFTGGASIEHNFTPLCAREEPEPDFPNPNFMMGMGRTTEERKPRPINTCRPPTNLPADWQHFIEKGSGNTLAALEARSKAVSDELCPSDQKLIIGFRPPYGPAAMCAREPAVAWGRGGQ